MLARSQAARRARARRAVMLRGPRLTIPSVADGLRLERATPCPVTFLANAVIDPDTIYVN